MHLSCCSFGSQLLHTSLLCEHLTRWLCPTHSKKVCGRWLCGVQMTLEGLARTAVPLHEGSALCQSVLLCF